MKHKLSHLIKINYLLQVQMMVKLKFGIRTVDIAYQHSNNMNQESLILNFQIKIRYFPVV